MMTKSFDVLCRSSMTSSPYSLHKAEVAGLARQLVTTHVDQAGQQYEQWSPDTQQPQSRCPCSPENLTLRADSQACTEAQNSRACSLPEVRPPVADRHLLSPPRMTTRSGELPIIKKQ